MEQQATRSYLIAYGDSVRTARNKAKLSQAKLSRLIPCSQAIISHIEQGYMLPPPYFKSTTRDIRSVKGS